MYERPIIPAQLRAGRALLGLSQTELAGRACLPLPTIKRAEADGKLGASVAAMAAIRVALEDQGVIFSRLQEVKVPAFACAALGHLTRA